jgi:hypothetical protein
MRSAAALLVVLLGAGVAGAQVDGSVCFKVRDTAPKGRHDVAILGQTCRIKTPAKMACLTGAATSVTPPAPVVSTLDPPPTMLCYRARCRPPETRPATLADDFGARGVVLRAGRFLCLSAGGADTIVTTTTTPDGSTTSTTRPENTCEFGDGMCGGTCPGPNQHCSFAEGKCKCIATPCGDADAPSCNGFCKPDEACLFVPFSGCQCVDIP